MQVLVNGVSGSSIAKKCENDVHEFMNYDALLHFWPELPELHMPREAFSKFELSSSYNALLLFVELKTTQTQL